ncbi:MAG: transposase [Nitrospirae bacterium CG_4_9_14_0_8_um_filter_70_14]|nr:MAG: transposase [Nitrospirae bacterium CG_4_9_14_0_8_um_filter_70_14]
MARKPRLHVPGGVYHVMLRGNAGQDIFFSEGDRAVFYLLVQEGIERFGHRVHGFCLMTHHVHLLLQVADVPLSRSLQNLAFRYTRWINRERGQVGHLFQGRYKAVLVDADAYLLELVRYIHLNPVRAGLVADPAEYPWSGHRAYLGMETLPWLHTEWVLGQFAKRLATSRKRYAAFVAAGMAEGHRPEFHGGDDDGRVLGEESFLAQVLEAPLAPPPPDLAAILDYVCPRYETNVDALGKPSRTHHLAEARGVIGWLAMHTGAATLTEVARRFHRDLATLSQAVRRIDLASQQDPAAARKLKRAINEITKA